MVDEKAPDAIAVIGADGISTEWGDRPIASYPARLSGLLAWARTRRVCQLWVHPDFSAVAGTLDDWYQAARMLDGWTLPERPQPWAETWQPGTYGRVALVLPYLETRAPWAAAASGRELLAALLDFRRAVGVPYRRSPGATGHALLRHLHSGRGTLDLSASLAPADFPPPARIGNTEADAMWMRPLTAEESRMGYVHAYDKSGMYLAACSSLKLGMGQPFHLTESRQWERVSSAQPGYWRVTPYASPITRYPELPPLFTSDEPLWATSPALALATDRGYAFKVHEAWVWPEAHQPLQPWYKAMREARAHLAEYNLLAYLALKACYTQSIGWLDLNAVARRGEPSDLYRPDWRHHIVAAARANMYRNLASAAVLTGRTPFAWAVDSLYYASDEPDPIAANPGLTLGTGLGHYKPTYTRPMSDVADIAAGRMDGLWGRRSARALQRRMKGTGEGAVEE